MFFHVAAAVTALWLVDRAIVSRRVPHGARYFVLHTLVNVVISILSAREVVEMVLDPQSFILSRRANTELPVVLNGAIHVYHSLAFSQDLVYLDYLHHGLMACVALPLERLTPSYKVCTAMHFFVMGLPGGVFNCLESLRVLGRMRPLTVKTVNNHLNMWIRVPGMIVCCTMAHLQTLTFIRDDEAVVWGSPLLYLLFRYFKTFLLAWNAIYFAQRVVVNYGVRMERDRLRR